MEDYGLPATDAHAELIAHVRRAGEKKSAHDLQIAATARVSGRTVVTTDRRAGFDRLPGVDCIVV